MAAMGLDDADFHAALQPLVVAVNANQRLTPKLRTALLTAILGAEELATVTALAHACECDRTTLWRHWQEGIGSQVGPKEVLQTVILLRSLATHALAKRGSGTYRKLIKVFGIAPTAHIDTAQLVTATRQYDRIKQALAGSFTERM